jgi:methionyl-tRNA synthetase
MATSPPQSFFIATPIFYVNDVPHIGHAYTEVAADVLARWMRQSGIDTWFLTGTDEHGQKILRTAMANGVSPKEWADRLVEQAWKPLLTTLNLANDDFIRTTEERHETAVKKFLTLLHDKGFIYQGEYEGFYCVGCEEYKTPADLAEGTDEFDGQKVCHIHGRPVEVLKEENYFFKMSDFQQKLLDLYRDRPDFIQPASVKNEIVAFVNRGLDDLSISRSNIDWGIELPFDEKHVTYVWFEALLNYITATGWGSDEEMFAKRWPAVQLVGKDIARFHAVIWPAMLMAAGLEPPRSVFAHGWLLVGGEKMSKSKLTGIAPSEITDVFGADAFRYYFLRAITFGSDGSFSWEDLSARYEAELANGFGNLASRVIAMIHRYRNGVIPSPEAGRGASEDALAAVMASAASQADTAMHQMAIHEALNQIWRIVEHTNGYLTEQEPWAMAKDPAQADRLDAVLYASADALRALAVLLSPFMPEATQKLWVALGAEATVGGLQDQLVTEAGAFGGLVVGSSIAELEPLFPRVEHEEA